MSKRIPFGIMLQGPGGHMNSWKHPSVPPDACARVPALTSADHAEASVSMLSALADRRLPVMATN